MPKTTFRPKDSSEWDTLTPESLNWCPEKIDSLYNFLDTNNTRAFILLKDSKIVLEAYFNGHGPEMNWYRASAGKTLTAMPAGIAREEGLLDIDAPTSDYLGEGWTDCTPAQEAAITVRHQLSMTTRLDDGVPEPNCTLSSCLQCS